MAISKVGKPEDAIKAYEKALTYYPNNVSLLLCIADAKSYLADYKELPEATKMF